MGNLRPYLTALVVIAALLIVWRATADKSTDKSTYSATSFQCDVSFASAPVAASGVVYGEVNDSCSKKPHNGTLTAWLEISSDGTHWSAPLDPKTVTSFTQPVHVGRPCAAGHWRVAYKFTVADPGQAVYQRTGNSPETTVTALDCK